ncbi:MAG: dipeptidase [Candidatus Eremiobacteraeota bacterium]|nr:dipeptidase [Candidatus Eremiobacteraeota bacterium]
MNKPVDGQLQTFCDERRDAAVAELKELVAIPSISADPAYKDDVRRCAQTLVEKMRRLGLASEVLETAGNPIAYGQWLGAPGKPTIIVYGHYDVQPVDPLELWLSPPFEATVRDGNIYGRGTVDDKGQVLMHLAAIQAHMATRKALPLNIKLVIEGEEEIGSPNFETFLAQNRDRLACDFAVISDTSVFAEDVPSLTVSLRGLVNWEVCVDGPSTDLHSGYYGGTICNPIEALAQMIAGLKDADGRVVVPGFYDGVPELSAQEQADLRALPYDEAEEAKKVGATELSGEAGRSPLERMWFRPTLELNGIWGGYQGAGAKTIIPSYARAKISARLVGSQEPEHVKKIVTDYLTRLAPPGVRVSVEARGDTRAVRTSRDHPAVAAAARAMESGFGKPAVFIGTGGTIGPVSSFDRILQLPQVLFGVGLPDDAIHAPNEKFTLRQFFGGIKAIAQLYDELAALS